MYQKFKRLKLAAILTLTMAMSLSTVSTFAMKSPIPVDGLQVEKECNPDVDCPSPIPQNNIDSIYGYNLQMQRYEAKRKLNLAKFNKVALEKLFEQKFVSISQSLTELRNNLFAQPDKKIKEKIRKNIKYLEDDYGFSHFQYHVLEKQCKKDVKKAEKFVSDLENECKLHPDQTAK